ncbi:MAG: hypothetical protein Q6355_09060, partial [Candidatus Brocadiales bacterium]|nr:hypothetical protein [Candidatus Brocadiales bacterium]
MIYNVGIIPLLSNNQIKKQIFKLIPILLITFVIINLSGVVQAVTLQGNIYKTSGKKYSARHWIKNGQSKYSRAKYELAVKAFKNSIACYPNYFEAWDGLGNALYCMGSYDAA